ncbi:MAG: M20/M25/M40 family metallo-hydrolase [Bacteroidales bacterium]|nr:M20/M25/M40 family metallo-hydrolase [Bacteroidales bacterium]
MTAKGIQHERIGNNLVAEHIVDSSLPTLMLCAHIDTVEPCEGYSFNPYNPENCPEDMVQGLGSNDDGASVVSMLAVFRSFAGAQDDRENALDDKENAQDDKENAWDDKENARDGKVDAKVNLILVLTCEEERSGVGGMTGLWSQLQPKVDYAIVGEPTGMKAAVSERGLLVIDATAHGVSGHAARNEGKNALYIALEDIDILRKYEFAKVSPKMGKVNLNVTQINAGSAHNVIPDRCDFVIDIRPTEQYSNLEILEDLQKVCKSELKARNLANKSSATYEESKLQAAAEKLGIETFSSATTSDWMRISCDAIKMGPGDSTRSHRKDEFVYIDEIRNAIETYIEFINTL